MSVPVIAECRNRECPSKQPVPTLGPEFEKPAQSILAKIRLEGGKHVALCVWCDKKAEPLEDIAEIVALGEGR